MREKGRREIVTPGVKPNLPSFPFEDDDPFPPETTGGPGADSGEDTPSTTGPEDTAPVPDDPESQPQTTSPPSTEKKPPVTTAPPSTSSLPVNADVYYKGKGYNYIDTLVNVLFIGVDKNSTDEGRNQADSLFLVSIGEGEKEVRVIGVSRNTIATISKLNASGQMVMKTETQICLAYGYGDTEKKCSELTVDAVSQLFYGLPIQGYYTIYMDEIADVVDYVGGVDVTVTGDVAGRMPGWDAGKKITLNGENALTYLRYRDMYQTGGNEQRFARQRGFLSGFLTAAKAKFKTDPSMPLNVFRMLSNRSTTNIGSDSAVYLATLVLNASLGSIQTVQGDLGTLFGRDALFINERALYELIIKNYYKQIS